jgi:site-specific recombinase XerD
LAAIRMLFDWLVVGQVVPVNPASAVRGPTHVVKTGKTPVLDGREWRRLLDAIPTETVRDLRDRALIATLTCSFARITTVLKMRVEDLRPRGAGLGAAARKRRQAARPPMPPRTGGEPPCLYRGGWYSRGAEGLAIARLKVGRRNVLSEEPMAQADARRMIRRRAKGAGIKAPIGCHTFRATGITAYLENGGTLEYAQAMAAHKSPRTTKLYDRTKERLTLDEIERIRL